MVSRVFSLVVLLVLPFASGVWSSEPDRWEEVIQAFEAVDRERPPEKGGVVFIGSSSIRLWDLDRFFPGAETLNRGFGGSQMADSVRYADRILLPYEPRTVVVYAGDNDIAAGKSAETVFADYKQFVAKVHDALPEARIVYIAIKPSLKRWNLVEEMRRANSLIQQASEADPRLSFVDIDTPMIGGDGQPRKELFVEDGLHLSAAGYEVWAELVRPHL
jgi:lysophospholipase L1-like esterase